MGNGWHTECAGGTPAEGGRKTTSPQSEFVGVGLARGACSRLLRNALDAATVMAVALFARQSLSASDTVAQLY